MMEDPIKMRNLKRFMSASLATLMIVAAMMTGVSAKSFDDVKPADTYAEQIEILSDIGVIKGTSDTEFSPDEAVTREQMALLLFRLMIGKDTAGKTNTTSFADLYDETYHGAISWANASGFIIGTSETTFEPTEGIMLQDAMTMLVRALGHESAQMNKGYPWTYIDKAIDLGLDAGLEKLSYEKELTRAEVAAILYNAMSAEYLIPKTAPNGMTYYESTTVIERVFGYDIDESVIVATNSHALEGVATVTKDGYVTVHTEDGLITVKFSELGLSGTPDSYLGKGVKLVYKRDDKTKLVSVLGCTAIGQSKPAEIIETDDRFSYIRIDGVKYQVVDELSDALSTNANELLVYAFDGTDTLVKVTSNRELDALTGAFDAELIFDSKSSETADRLIIKPYSFGELVIEDGKVNLADGAKLSDITVTGDDKVKSGDHVLYYYNSDSKILEIAALLPVTEEAAVTRLTADSATVGGKRYTLGCEKLGVSAEDIRAQLTVGEKVHAVLYGNMILAVKGGTAAAHAESRYLIADSDVTPVFTAGKLGYAMDVIIDGKQETVIVTNRSVTVGDVYRYTVDKDGIYTLIPARISGSTVISGDNEFVQSNSHNDELAFIVSSADGTAVTKGSSYYTLSAGNASAAVSSGMSGSAVKFVTDKNTVILMKTDGEWKISKGVYSSDISVEDGASVTAVFRNEAGSVETLRCLVITDGTLGSVDAAAATVKVLAHSGKELIDGTVYSVYTVLELATGEIKTMHSKSSALAVGSNYLTDINGNISETAASAVTGTVSGYTAGTLTLGSDTYKLAGDVSFIRITDSTEVKPITVKDVFMKKAELVISGDEVKTVILLGDSDFEGTVLGDTLTVTSIDGLHGSFEPDEIRMIHHGEEEDTELDADMYDITVTSEAPFTFELKGDADFAPGDYTVVFKLGTVKFSVTFTV